MTIQKKKKIHNTFKNSQENLNFKPFHMFKPWKKPYYTVQKIKQIETVLRKCDAVSISQGNKCEH